MIVIKLKEHRRPSETQFNLVVNGLRFEHKNILQLKGYCDETVEAASKRLLCYELLQNGSLDRKIFGGKKTLPRTILNIFYLSTDEFLHFCSKYNQVTLFL